MGMAKQIINEIVIQAGNDVDAWEANGDSSFAIAHGIQDVYAADAEGIRNLINEFEEYSNIVDFLEGLYDLDTIVREAMYDTVMLTEKWNERLEVGIFQQ